MTADIANTKSRDAIKRKSAGNTQNRTRQTHRQSNTILPTRGTIKARDDPIKFCTNLM